MNKIEICNIALDFIGADVISTFSDETRESRICNNSYELITKSCLSERGWTFAKNLITLNKLSSQPLFGYSSASQLPSDYIRLEGKSNPGMPHSINEKYLYCNAEEIKISYIFRASEENFPEYFTLYLVNAFAKVLSISLLEDENKSAYYAKEALESRRKAGFVDSQSNGNTVIPIHNFSIVSVRF